MQDTQLALAALSSCNKTACWTGPFCSRAGPCEALGQRLPSGTVYWMIPARCDTRGAKYLVLHDVFQQRPVPSHGGGVGWMEPARTALSICAELPDRLPRSMASPGPSPALLAQGPALPSPLRLRPLPFTSLTTFIFGKHLTGGLFHGEAQDSWVCGLTKHCASLREP